MTDSPSTRCEHCGNWHTRQSRFCSEECEKLDAEFRAWDTARRDYYARELRTNGTP